MRRAGATRVALLAVGCMLIGCAGSGGGDGGGPSGPACRSQVPGNPVSYSANIQPIYERSCALSGCHVPPILNGGLDMTAARSYAQTVGVPAQQQPRLKRVAKGDPDDSYLLQKIVGTPTISGVLMPQGCPATPLNGAQCLTADEIDAIRTWILECAPNN